MAVPTSRAADAPIDVAVNIFAKPFQTALSLLSLLRASGRHVGVIHLQFEPAGSRYDSVSPYAVADWLREELGADRCAIFQPDYWLDLNAADLSRMGDPAYRAGVRYQCAFERSGGPLLLLMHNDVFVQRDILGAMREAMGDAFAIGQVGQCWNCPASNAELMRGLFGREPCGPGRHEEFRPSYGDLRALYDAAKKAGVFVRPYDEAFEGIFDILPWPLPECRVNEWACLLDLERTRPLTMPFGPALPPGAYRQCGPICLDIGVEWFRAMHAHGMRARHFPVERFLTHWVGTGKVTAGKYARAENNALSLLRRHFPRYVEWLCRHEGLSEADLPPRAPRDGAA